MIMKFINRINTYYDFDSKCFFLEGKKQTSLPPIPEKILEILASNIGVIISNDAISNHFRDDISYDSVKSHISSIKKFFKYFNCENFIITIYAKGYKCNEQIVQLHNNAKYTEHCVNDYKNYEWYINFVSQNLKDVKEVCVSTYAGTTWTRSSDNRYNLIKSLCDKKIPIRFLINNSSNYEILIKIMRDRTDFEDGLYDEYNNIVKRWKSIINKYKNNIQVRICNRPIVNSYILPVMQSEERLFPACIGIYRYSNHDCATRVFSDINEKCTKEFVEEFEYLWKHESVEIGDLNRGFRHKCG